MSCRYSFASIPGSKQSISQDWKTGYGWILTGTAVQVETSSFPIPEHIICNRPDAELVILRLSSLTTIRVVAQRSLEVLRYIGLEIYTPGRTEGDIKKFLLDIHKAGGKCMSLSLRHRLPFRFDANALHFFHDHIFNSGWILGRRRVAIDFWNWDSLEVKEPERGHFACSGIVSWKRDVIWNLRDGLKAILHLQQKYTIKSALGKLAEADDFPMTTRFYVVCRELLERVYIEFDMPFS